MLHESDNALEYKLKTICGQCPLDTLEVKAHGLLTSSKLRNHSFDKEKTMAKIDCTFGARLGDEIVHKHRMMAATVFALELS